jgi:hypothetical protein
VSPFSRRKLIVDLNFSIFNDTGFDQCLVLEEDLEAKNRTVEITKIAKTVNELNKMFADISKITIEQGKRFFFFNFSLLIRTLFSVFINMNINFIGTLIPIF